MIEKGKITEIIKKATFGGALKIRVFDTSGKIIRPSSDLPEGAEIHVSIDSANYIIGTLSRRINKDNMDDGETIVRTLFQSTFNICKILPVTLFFQGSFTVQCKFTGKANKNLQQSDLKDEFTKERRLASCGLADNRMR